MKDNIQITKTEKLIIQLIAFEFTTQDIAEILFISKHTVETHRANLMSKIGAKNLAGIVRLAIEHGMLMSREELVKHPRLSSMDIFEETRQKVHI